MPCREHGFGSRASPVHGHTYSMPHRASSRNGQTGMPRLDPEADRHSTRLGGGLRHLLAKAPMRMGTRCACIRGQREGGRVPRADLLGSRTTRGRRLTILTSSIIAGRLLRLSVAKAPFVQLGRIDPHRQDLGSHLITQPAHKLGRRRHRRHTPKRGYQANELVQLGFGRGGPRRTAGPAPSGQHASPGGRSSALETQWRNRSRNLGAPAGSRSAT